MAEPRRYSTRSGHPARIITLLAAALVYLLAPSQAAAVPAGGAVKKAEISQTGKKLIFQVRTGKQVALRDLERMPDLERARASYLCFEMTRSGSKIISRICVGGKKNSHHRVGITRTNRVNKVYSRDTVAASLKRVGDRKLVFSIDPEGSRLKPASYSWRVVLSDGSCEPGRFTCRKSFPEDSREKVRIKPLVMTGCTGGDGEFVTHGPRGKKRIALTFDDGPSLYTPQVLHILKAHGIKATFFMLGTEVERYPDTARRILKHGHELANHSTRHLALPSVSDIKNTSSIIERTTGFRPCLFRPPGGAISSGVLAGARAAKMKTVNWDVDTNDWRLPGSGSIYNTLTHARSGSIVLMHDGGGPRSQTVDALSDGIEKLQRKGYELVTVTELLGNEFRYQPR